MGTLEYSVLGPVEVRVDGHPVDLGPSRRRTTLAALLVDAGRTVPTDVLVERVWDGRVPAKPLPSLHAYVSRLRAGLGDGSSLRRERAGYRLDVDPSAVDAVRFEAALTRARGLRADGDVAGARDAVGTGLALWRDRAYVDVPGRFAADESDRLAALQRAARELAAGLDLDLGRHAGAVGELEELVAADPLSETLQALLMLALHRCGRDAEALRRYAALRAAVADELGAEPGAAVRDLHTRILRGDPGLDLPAHRGPASGAPGGPRTVGRDGELRTVRAALARAWSGGAAAAVAVLGEAGIGKTRLVEDVAAAVPGGVVVVRGRCWEHGGTPVLWPWARMVHTLLSALPPDEVAGVLGPRAGTLATVVTDLPGSPPGPPAASGAVAVFDALAGVLAAVAARRPVLLVLEDAHWADPASLEMAEYLIGHTAAPGVALLVTVRVPDDGGNGAARTLLAALARDPAGHTVTLIGLDADAVRTHVRDVSGVDVDVDTAAALTARTGGNPFFVGELARLLEHGEVPDTVPDGVREVVLRRVARLDDGGRRTLAAAAVLGHTFDPDLLVTVSGLEADDVDDAVDRAVAAGFLCSDPSGTGGLRFAHDIVRRAVVDDVGPARRRRLHLRAARGLDARAPVADGPDAERIVGHLAGAGGPEHLEEAADRQLALVDAALRRGNYLAARVLIGGALALVARGPAAPQREMAALVRLCTLEDFEHGPVGEYDVPARVRVVELARSLPAGRDATVARITAWGMAIGVADYPAATAATDELELTARAAGDVAALTVAHAQRAQILMNQGRLREAEARFTDVIDGSARFDTGEWIGAVVSSPLEVACGWRAFVRTVLDDHEGAARDLDACLAVVRASDQPAVVVHGLGTAALVEAARDRPAAAERHARGCCDRAAQVGLLSVTYYIGIVRAWAAVRLGRTGAVVDLRRAVDAVSGRPTMVLRPLLHGLAAEALDHAGDDAGARRLLDRAADEMSRSGAALSLPRIGRPHPPVRG